jgi:hypothetical protein
LLVSISFRPVVFYTCIYVFVIRHVIFTARSDSNSMYGSTSNIALPNVDRVRTQVYLKLSKYRFTDKLGPEAQVRGAKVMLQQFVSRKPLDARSCDITFVCHHPSSANRILSSHKPAKVAHFPLRYNMSEVDSLETFNCKVCGSGCARTRPLQHHHSRALSRPRFP